MKVVRILVYEGTEDWVKKNLALRTVKGRKDLGHSSITEVFIGQNYEETKIEDLKDEDV